MENGRSTDKGSRGMVYRHSERAGLLARILKALMLFTGRKHSIQKILVKQVFRHEPAPLPGRLRKNPGFKTEKFKGRTIWTIESKGSGAGITVLFMHGGAYISNILRYHWEFLGKLHERTGVRIIIPDYPLAPKTDCEGVYSFMESLVNEILSRYGGDRLVFMGDSAGGGLALGLAQQIRDRQASGPDSIILLSPWLDVTMTNPDIPAIAGLDFMLGVPGLDMAGKKYAGRLDLKDPRVSPIYGDSRGLGQISVFIGTHDVLYPDCILFRNRMNDQKEPVNFYEYPEMFHDWMLVTQLPEAESALKQISALVNSKK